MSTCRKAVRVLSCMVCAILSCTCYSSLSFRYPTGSGPANKKTDEQTGRVKITAHNNFINPAALFSCHRFSL